MIHRGIESGFVRRNIDHLRVVLDARLKRLVAGLRKYAPSLEFEVPEGGYFLWVKLPGGITAAQALEAGKPHGVAFTPGNKTSTTGQLGEFMRLSFAFYTNDELEEGARRMGLMLADLGKGSPVGLA